MTESSAGTTPIAFSDPGYRAAVVDLLAVIAYAEISAFERLAADARMAPNLADKVALATMASAEFENVLRLHARLEALGADPYAAMEPFREPLEAFHRHTAPSDWLEGLVKAYVGDGLARDFYREIAAFVDVESRELIVSAMERPQHSEFVVEKVREAIEADPRVAGRLALWGRRLMGEALTQAQGVAAERDALSALLAGGVDVPSLDLAALGRMFSRLTEKHAERMARLGLAH